MVAAGEPVRTIGLYDVKGALPREWPCGEELQKTLPTGSLPTGSYYITVTLQTGATQVEKLLGK